ncbi:hypothetical protein A0257_13895 [Hymenobacter psoromatis]|nr:hypothetical protein A0257_13895 [Hymenobacter psoromatis]
MRKLFTQVSLLLTLAGAALVACKKDADTLRPAPGAASPATPPTLAQLKTWYAGRTNARYSRPTGTTASATRTAGTDSLGWLAIQWQRLDTISNGAEPLAFLPIEGGPAGIATGYQGYRRIVVGQRAGSSPTGFILEVLHKGETLAPAQLNQVFRALYTAQQQGQVAQLPGFTGFAACYTRENYYLTGRAYRQGVASAGRAWLSFRPAPAASPDARKPGMAHTNEVNITCVSAVIDVSTSLEAKEIVIWTCTVSGGGGGSPPPAGGTGGNTGGGNTGTDNPGGSYGGGSGGGSGGGGGGGPLVGEQYNDDSGNGYGGTPPSSSSPASTIIKDNLPPCTKSILASLQNINGTDVGGIFALLGNSTTVTWTVKTGAIPPSSNSTQPPNAITETSGNTPFEVTTTLQSTYVSQATNVAVARTLIHESLHTYLGRWGKLNSMPLNATLDELLNGYMKGTDFS